MVSVNNRYQSHSDFMRADDLKVGDLDVQILTLELDRDIKGKTVDILSFRNWGQQLILNPTVARQIAAIHGDETRGWEDKWITLFRDETVKFEGRPSPGVRVRPKPPNNGLAGPAHAANAAPATPEPIDDSVPF
jgi:hypothetical protein